MGFAAELRRLDRSRAGARGRRWASRAVVLALLGFLVLALVHRTLVPLPGFSALRHVLWAPLAVLAVAALAWALARLASLAATFDARRLARRLDEGRGLRDLADAALSVERRGAAGPLCDLVVARATDAARAAAALFPEAEARRSRRLPTVLGALVVAVLLLPGVMGFGGRRGAGRGTDLGVGQRPPDEAPADGSALTPEDADRWLREHARLRLEVPDPKRGPLDWIVALRSDAPFPAAYRARLAFRVDGREGIPSGGETAVAKGEPALEARLLNAASIARLKEALTPGKHRVTATLTPAEGPWTLVLESPPIEVEIEPSSSSPQPRPEPPPQPEPPPPPPPTPATEPPPEPPPPPPPVAFRDEVVTPLMREGERVKKDEALVAVPDPDSGLTPPPAIPLARALAEFGPVVERAVLSERVLPADREFLRRYLDALRRAAGADR